VPPRVGQGSNSVGDYKMPDDSQDPDVKTLPQK